MSDIMRRSWRLTAAGVCIGTLLVLVAFRLENAQVFEARSAVVLDPDKLPREVLRWDGEIDLRKLVVALESDAALHVVIVRAFPSPSSPEAERNLAHRIRSQLGWSYSRRTRILEFRFRDSEPGRAAEVVNLFARFFGEEDLVSLAAPAAVLVFPRLRDYLAVGIAGGLLGGLLVFVGQLLGRIAIAARGWTLKTPG